MMLRELMLAMVLVLTLGAQEKDTEKKVKRAQLPAAVQKAVNANSQGAKIEGFSQETEDGKTYYEAAMKVNGRTKDVMFDADGNVVSVEQEIALEEAPAAVREALGKMGKVTRIEKVTKGSAIYYEADVKSGGKKQEIKLDAAGKTLP